MTRKITIEMFEQATGMLPIYDDIERCNCPNAGELGHWSCGWCESKNLPYFMIGAVPKQEREEISMVEKNSNDDTK